MDTSSNSVNRTDWAWLESGVLDMILNKLDRFSDIIQFGVVCKSWYSVAENQRQQRLNTWYKQLPLLMIPTTDGSQYQRSLYSATRRKVLNFKLQVPYNKRCCGSSHGWVSFLNIDLSVLLFNPFTGAEILLPPIKHHDVAGQEIDINDEDHIKYYQYDVSKVIFSVDPSLSNDYIIVAIVHDFKSLAYLKFGDNHWKRMGWRNMRRIPISDVIFYDNRILAVGYEGQLVLSDYIVDNIDHLELQQVLSHNYSPNLEQWYIVESSKKILFLIQRFLKPKGHLLALMTTKFKTYRILPGWRTVETKDIQGDGVFLGDNYSVSVLASNYPGCQPNSIYYTEDNVDTSPYFPFGPRDIGIFNLKNGKFGLHYIPDRRHKDLPPPIWIMPNFTGNTLANLDYAEIHRKRLSKLSCGFLRFM